MNFSPIELITTVGGPQRADATGEAQPDIFAGLLFASGAATVTSKSDHAGDPLSQLADLLGTPIAPGVALPGNQTSPALTAFLQNAALGTSATGDGTDSSPSSTPDALANALPSALSQLATGGQALAQGAKGNEPANTVEPARPRALSAAASASPIGSGPSAASTQSSGLPLTGVAAGIDVVPPSTVPAAPNAEAEQTRSLVSGSAIAKPPAQQQIEHLGRSSVAASSPPDKPAINGAHAQQGSGGSPAHLQVTVSQPVAVSQAAAAISPEMAAAVLTSQEQAQTAAQSSALPNGPTSIAALSTGPLNGQVTREERKQLQSPRSQANVSVTNQASSRPRAHPTRQVETVPTAGASLSTPSAELATPVPQSEFATGAPSSATGLASLAAPPGELISSTGLQSDSQRGQWRPTAPADQVAVHIKKAIGEGKGQVTIQLEPAELGRIEIRLAASGDGAIRAAIMAESPETLELLQSDARALERALQDAGIRTNSDSLSFNLRGEGQNGKFSEQERNGGPRETDDQGQLDDSALGAEAAMNRSRHDGSLDISV